ncbi:MAG: hypothetical protein Tsb0027_18230 [Wenzhouxiangellaceae bacterium]
MIEQHAGCALMLNNCENLFRIHERVDAAAQSYEPQNTIGYLRMTPIRRLYCRAINDRGG